MVGIRLKARSGFLFLSLIILLLAVAGSLDAQQFVVGSRQVRIVAEDFPGAATYRYRFCLVGRDSNWDCPGSYSSVSANSDENSIGFPSSYDEGERLRFDLIVLDESNETVAERTITYTPARKNQEGTSGSGRVIVSISGTGLVSWPKPSIPSGGSITYIPHVRLADIGDLVAYGSQTGETFQIPGFDPESRYGVVIVFRIHDSGGVLVDQGSYTQTWPLPLILAGRSIFHAMMPDGRISPHPGTTLLVWIEGGRVLALDFTLDVELSAPANCSRGRRLLARNDALRIECLARNEFRVTQLNPQHPQDGRRDILVFDTLLTNCYRAYEYIDSGAIEVFWREC